MAVVFFDVMGVLLQSYPYAQDLDEEMILIPDMDKIVTQLKLSGHRLFAISHASDALLKKWAQQFDLFSHFQLVCSAQSYGGLKREVAFYHQFLEKQGLDVKECFLIDDSGENIQAALRAGLKTVHYKDAKSCRQVLNDYGLLIS